MKYYDQHLHTFLSFDSQEIFKNYLLNNPAYFVATDHFDLHNPGDNFHDDIPDYEKLTQKIHELEANSPLPFLRAWKLALFLVKKNKSMIISPKTPMT
ncbi:histidinol-phosphatase [Tetragenococcus muriaticus PMC-11-5]|uniref:Histidinol-phosphatase n=1 Tax=Tetragenococcus muriaticus PMC-11-5 TaxID=1302649 RepID=A0A091CA98_9ENTE|nr:histidinol-phosphatase [Tetragenococcus muriaticus PMC-11-5]